MKTTHSLPSRVSTVGRSNANKPVPLPSCRRPSRFRRLATALLAAGAGLMASSTIQAANIVWVSDANDPAEGFFPAGSNYTDSGFVTLLQNAGHNVIRFNQPNAQATLLTAAQLAALNTNDLVIIGRCVNSAAFQPPQGDQWNVAITKPLIGMSPYHTRREGPNRLGWFLGNTSDNFDDTPTPLKAIVSSLPAVNEVVDYLFAEADMEGTNTAEVYTVPMDRNTSQIAGAPVAGGIPYATVNYVQQNNTATPPTMNSGYAFVGFPAGTPVRYDTNILAGYRMFIACGSRESATAPNGISAYAGRENLTPMGEKVFLRAIQIAINSGVAPISDPLAPVGFTSQPASATVTAGGSVTLSVSVTGAAPRTLQWQVDSGDGNFVDVADASTVFLRSKLTLSNLTTASTGFRYRVVATNPNNSVTSDPAVITVNGDSEGPVILSVGSVDGTNVTVIFNELLNKENAENTFGYAFENAINATAAVLRPDGRSVDLVLDGPVGPSFNVVVSDVTDIGGNAIVAPGNTAVGINHGLVSVDVGALTPAGASLANGTNTFELTGGGTVIAGNADQLRFAYQSASGDFDARVRVLGLTGTWDHLESTAKAVLAARETTDTGAGNITAYVTPLAPGDDSVGTTVRTNAAGATGNIGPVVVPGGLPTGWLRLTRVGNLFTSYRSSDGTAWNQLGSISLNYGESMVVGPGVSSHRSGRTVTGTFSQFSVTLLPRIANLGYTAGVFTGSFATQSGKSYRVEYKEQFSDPAWQLLSTIEGDGTTKTFTDNGPAGSQRFYRVTIP